MYLNRTLEKLFLKYNSEYSVILLTGQRQSGKTTMLENLIKKEGKNRNYVSLDTPNLRQQALYDTENFFKLYKPPILIDEVQNVPSLFPYIKSIVDKNKKPGSFWLTGSHIFKMMENVEESLAGRVCNLHMTTLSLSEIYKYDSMPFTIDNDELINKFNNRKSNKPKNLYKDILSGSMPAIISKDISDKEKYYENYLTTYLDKDLRYISSKIEIFKFQHFVKILASFSGQVLNVNNLSLISGANVKTINNYLNILEKLGIIFYLHPYSNNLLKRTISKPKLYFYDLGLVTYLLDFENENDVKKYNQFGALFENYVISEIIKTYINEGKNPHLYFYRDIDNKEIDLIIENKDTLYPIEIKASSNPSNKIFSNFNVLKKADKKIGTTCIICNTDNISSYDKGNVVIPYWLI